MTDNPFNKYSTQAQELKEALRLANPLREYFEERDRMLEIANPQLSAFAEAAKLAQQYRDMINPPELAAYRQAMEEMSAISKFAKQFQIEQDAIRQVREQFASLETGDILNRYRLERDTLTKAFADAYAPFEQFRDQAWMMSSLSELHGIGSVARSISPFDDWATSALRIDLGDWQKPIAFNSALLVESRARIELYAEMGFDRALVDLPQPVFRSGMESSGLYVPDIDYEQIPDDDALEQGFIRTNDAHNRLMRFEHGLRVFIEGALTNLSGEDWAERHVPKEMLDTWKAKRVKAIASGDAVGSLIEYADFTDYQVIIIQRENWRLVFGPIFKHKPSVEESFRRLYPVRLATMHARIIQNEDAIYLLSEITRLSRAIGI